MKKTSGAKQGINSPDTLYRKSGSHYVEVGYEFTGFPAEGIWIVQNKTHGRHETLILKIGDVPNLYPYANLMLDVDELGSLIADHRDAGPWCPNGMATEIMQWIAKKAEERK